MYPRKEHDLVIRKMVQGLYWLYHRGKIINEASTEIIIAGNLHGDAYLKKMVSKFYRSVAFKKNQFVITHCQSEYIDNNQDNPFFVSFHFYPFTVENIEQGYHCFAALFTNEMKRNPKKKSIFQEIQDSQKKSKFFNSYILKENGKWKKTKE